MTQIAKISKNSLNFNRGTRSCCFWGRIIFRWRESMKTSGRVAISPLPSCPSNFIAYTGARRCFCESLPASLPSRNDRATTRATSTPISDQGNCSQSTSSEPISLPLEKIELGLQHQHATIDKFTHFALNSHTIPLGSMQEKSWMDVLDAIDAWLDIGGGFAVDSAERLLERLLNEQAALFSNKKSKMTSSYSHRSMILINLQRDILNAWIQIFQLSEGSSQLALSRAEQSMFRLLNLLTMVDKMTTESKFPFKEYISVVEGYLHLRTNKEHGAEKAGSLLLRLTLNGGVGWDVGVADHSARISRLYEKCATQLLTIDSQSFTITQLLKTMTSLKESKVCLDMMIPDFTERIIPEATLQSKKIQDESTKRKLSPFEVEVVENRLIDVLKNAGEGEKNTVNGLVEKLAATRLSNDVMVALIEYHLKIGDSEIASNWLQQLEASFLVSSYDLVERVLESWLLQRGSRIPWRADEFFKAVTMKILQHDEKFAITTRSLELIVGNWAASEDPSASRKIIEWYSQMISSMVKPSLGTLKMTIQALSRVDIDNPLILISNDLLQHWDKFSEDDKNEIAKSVLEVISLRNEHVETILSLVGRFREDNLFPDNFLCQSALSAVRIDASPSDVLTIVDSFGNPNTTTRGIDLSLYTLAIDTLFKLDKDARTEIQSLYDNAMKRVVANPDAYGPNDFFEFLYSVIAMYVHRKLYHEAESCLRKVEDSDYFKFHTKNFDSPIPLKCYKKLIVRKWYTATTAEKIEESFEKLMKLYREGYSNLQPDCELYTAYIEARVIRKKNVEPKLEEMVELYRSSKNEETKPRAKVFNAVLLSLAQDKRNLRSLYNKSIKLLDCMSDLEVQPDVKTFNLVLKNLLKANIKEVYKKSLTIVQMIEENNLKPDSHTLHLIIDACGSPPREYRRDALRQCLSIFGEIREKQFVGPITYGILSKVIYRLTSKDYKAEKISRSLLSMCCEDGMLSEEVRGRLQSMMSQSEWEKEYVSQLSSDGREPAAWSRNITVK